LSNSWTSGYSRQNRHILDLQGKPDNILALQLQLRWGKGDQPMNLFSRFAVASAFLLLFSAPHIAHAGLSDELLDSTHDMRAQMDLKTDNVSNFDAPVTDSWSVVSGGSPFSQGTTTIEDNTPGLDIGADSNASVATLEDLDDSQ
jgi:hypothetical protein